MEANVILISHNDTQTESTLATNIAEEKKKVNPWTNYLNES